MADKHTNITGSVIISGSRVKGSNISVQHTQQGMTDTMWQTVFRLADTFGKNDELTQARELKASLDRDDRQTARPLWQRLRAFLGVFADAGQIIEAIDTLLS